MEESHERLLHRRGVKESWLTIKVHLLQTQQPSIKREKEAYRRWKHRKVAQQECRDAVQVCKDQVRKDKAQLELILERYVNGNRKGFYRYIRSRMNNTEGVGLLLNGSRDLVTKDMQKVGVVNATFTSVFTGKTGLQQFQVPKTNGRLIIES